MTHYLGVDPGESGAMVLLSSTVGPDIIKNDSTEHDLACFLRGWAKVGIDFAYIERVSAMPGNGAASMFKFGKSYGFLRGLLIACGIPFEEVTPRKWQAAMGCLSGGDKNVTKGRAQQLFPSVKKITHATADALLIAEYCRRTRSPQVVAHHDETATQRSAG